MVFFFFFFACLIREVAETIIESDEWFKAFQSEYPSRVTGVRETPLRTLIKQFPDLAKMVFDRCMQTNLQSDTKQVSSAHIS